MDKNEDRLIVNIKEKWKAYLSIAAMTLFFFLAVETKYSRASGDYILEMLGLRSWTGIDTGLHLTVIYCMVLSTVCLYYVEKYAIQKLKMKKRSILLAVVVLCYAFSIFNNGLVHVIKGNSEGLMSIAYLPDHAYMSYDMKDGVLEDLKVDFTLKNLGRTDHSFSVSIDSKWLRKDGMVPIEILDKEGEPVTFVLGAKETKRFELNQNEYSIVGGHVYSNGGSKGGIEEIILTGEDGKKIRLNNKEYYGVEVKR